MTSGSSLDSTGKRSILTGGVLAFIHLGACLAVVPAFFSWPGFAAGVVLYYLTGGIGICLGYHRMLTHRSVRFARPVEYAIATIGALALQGGPISWVSTHRAHHAFSDTERDPHDSSRGFWWSHLTWMFRTNPARLSLADQRRYAPDLAADGYYRFLEAATPALQVVLAVALYAIGGWSWLVWAGFVRLVFTYHATWLVNSGAHLTGVRSYRSAGADRATNNWWVALVAWGEGWHNNHHAFPFSARHGLRWFEFDPTWLAIRVLAFLRVARDVKLPTAEMLQRRARALAPLPGLQRRAAEFRLL